MHSVKRPRVYYVASSWRLEKSFLVLLRRQSTTHTSDRHGTSMHFALSTV